MSMNKSNIIQCYSEGCMLCKSSDKIEYSHNYFQPLCNPADNRWRTCFLSLIYNEANRLDNFYSNNEKNISRSKSRCPEEFFCKVVRVFQMQSSLWMLLCCVRFDPPEPYRCLEPVLSWPLGLAILTKSSGQSCPRRHWCHTRSTLELSQSVFGARLGTRSRKSQCLMTKWRSQSR